MRLRMVLATALATLMLVGPLSAQGGPYTVDIRRGTAAMIGTFGQGGVLTPVPLADGSRGFVFLFENEPSDVRGNLIFPQPDPKADLTRAKEFIGCILVFKANNSDFGCEVQSPAYIQTDPLFGETTVVFTAQSFRPDGFRLSATLVLTGQGAAPQPRETHEARIEPTAPARPTLAFAAGSAYLARDAIARGSIRSDLVGGGAVNASTTVNSSMFYGLFGFESLGEDGMVIRPGVVANVVTDDLVCLGSDPVVCYP